MWAEGDEFLLRKLRVGLMANVKLLLKGVDQRYPRGESTHHQGRELPQRRVRFHHMHERRGAWSRRRERE